MDKDRDALAPDLNAMVLASDDVFLRNLFVERDAEPGGPPSPAKGQHSRSRSESGGSTTKKGISMKFSDQLRQLMRDLDSTGSHYIRCIKSNDLKAPLLVNWPEVLRQLMYAGVQQIITIRKNGYLYKTPFGKFVARYHPILGIRNIKSPVKYSSEREECIALLAYMQLPHTDVLVGKTRLFYRIEQHRILERHLKATEVRFILFCNPACHCYDLLNQALVKDIVLKAYKMARWRRTFLMSVTKKNLVSSRGHQVYLCGTG